MREDYRRHDISDRAWGRVAQDNRRFINAVIGILRTVAPWRDLPPEYGDLLKTLTLNGS